MTPSRRQVLSAGVVSLAAACTADRAPAPVGPDRDTVLATAAAARERALLDAYARVLATRPDLAVRLAPVLGDHAAHLARLGEHATPAPSAAGGAAAPTPGPTTLDAVRALERATAAAHARAAETASRDLAPVLASLAACEAVHAVVLA